jgi:hypothetical protein
VSRVCEHAAELDVAQRGSADSYAGIEYRIEHVRKGRGGMPAWAARAAALARGANDPDALSEGAIPPLPLELRSLCKGAWHRYASGGAVPLLPHEMRRCEMNMC